MTELRRGDVGTGLGKLGGAGAVVANIRDITSRLDGDQRDRRTLQRELGFALDRDELAVWYQPMIDLHTDRVAGVEALVRWDHPRRGLLAPHHFIEVAEASGLIRALGSRVLRAACSDAHDWSERGCDVHISINVAAAQLADPFFAAEIEAASREFGLDPERITIEITERSALQVSGLVDALQSIRALGVRLALDDFGPECSSLPFLRELPIDTLKLDRPLVRGLGGGRHDPSIVQGVLSIAATLGHEVVAEGVETVEEAEMLRRLGCRYAQGFLWSRPVPADQIEARVRGRAARSHDIRR